MSNRKTKELKVAAKTENLERVLAFICSVLKEAGDFSDEEAAICIAVEEIFVNIAHYAYPGEEGEVLIEAEVTGTPSAMTVTLTDSGREYDPLSRPDPDTTLPDDERPIGGLGIFMAKQLMDGIEYRREAGKNVLLMVKKLAAGFLPEDLHRS